MVQESIFNKLPGTFIHIVFDDYAYYPDSFIPLSKARKSDGAERNINNLNQVLPNPSEWQEFVSNAKNKLSICKLLAEFFVSGEVYTEKNVFVTKEKKYFVKYANQVAIEKPEFFAMHREADHWLVFHANCSADNGDSVCVVADDTDVCILLLFVSNQTNGTIYFRQGTSLSKQGITYHNVTAFANELGNDICNILPAFHALNSSDFTRTFYRRSKIQSFKKFMKTQSKSDLLHSLQTKNSIVSEVTDFVIHIICNRPNQEGTPGNSRYAMLFFFFL